MDIKDEVTKIIVYHLVVKESEVKPEARLVEDLGADSLDSVELTMALEEEFVIKIPDEDAEKTKTVQDVINYISKRLTEKKQ